MERDVTGKILGICNLVIVFKYFMTVIFQGIRRTRAPEDGFQPPAVTKEAKPLKQDDNATGNDKNQFTEEQRWQRIVLNDLENVPIGVVMMWVSLFVSGHPAVTAVGAIGLTLGRCSHTLCYVYKLMPWRSVAWLIGVLSTLALAGNIVYGVFQHAEKYNLD
eukprot:688011_1